MATILVTGRVIRHLPIEIDGRIIWDGTGIAGQKVNSGCYILAVQTGNRTVSQRFNYTSSLRR